MRVLLVTNVFPPAIGGPATFGARLAMALDEQGHKVHVVCGTEDAEGLHTYPFPVIRAGTRGNRLWRELDLRMRLLQATYLTDVVYCMGLEHQTSWACRVARKPFALRIGGDSVWEAARNMGVTDLEPEAFYIEATAKERMPVAVPESRRREQFRRAACVVYVSEYLRGLAGAWCSERPAKEHVICNGIPVEARREPSRRLADEQLRVLFVGRQTNWKGVDAMLLALRQTAGVELTIAGSGPARPANVDLARRLGLSNRVTFVDGIDSRKMVDFMAYYHVLVLPSLYEGLSNTLLEAGLAGLACIASNRGGNPEVIRHGETGFLVDPFNIDDIAEALTHVASNEDVRLQWASEHAERVVTRFDMTRAISETIRVFEHVA